MVEGKGWEGFGIGVGGRFGGGGGLRREMGLRRDMAIDGC